MGGVARLDKVRDRILHALATGEQINLVPADLAMPIYHIACRMLDNPDQVQSIAARIPESLLPLLRAEYARVRAIRRTVIP